MAKLHLSHSVLPLEHVFFLTSTAPLEEPGGLQSAFWMANLLKGKCTMHFISCSFEKLSLHISHCIFICNITCNIPLLENSRRNSMFQGLLSLVIKQLSPSRTVTAYKYSYDYGSLETGQSALASIFSKIRKGRSMVFDRVSQPHLCLLTVAFSPLGRVSVCSSPNTMTLGTVGN